MKRIVVAALFVVAWSSGFVGATLGDRAATPAALLAWRYLATAGVLAAVVLISGRARELRTLGWRGYLQQVVLGLLAHVVFLGGVFGAAAAGLEAGLSCLVCALQPMLVAAAGALWWRDRLGPSRWLGLILGIAGVGIGVGQPGNASGSGVLLVAASVLALSGAALLERRWKPQVSVLTSLFIQVVAGAAAFSAYACATRGMAVHPSPELWMALAWLVVLSGLAGYAGFTLCVRTFGATGASTLLYLTPAVTTLWAWLMFDQSPSRGQVFGMCVVALGVGLSMRRNKSPARQPTSR